MKKGSKPVGLNARKSYWLQLSLLPRNKTGSLGDVAGALPKALAYRCFICALGLHNCTRCSLWLLILQ
ncbi:hypothetical protein Hdeb2414_s0025g00657611 [Helianthus debilis subsp. tardiflorus]